MKKPVEPEEVEVVESGLQKAVAFLKKREKFEPRAYPDPAKRLGWKVPTIGYGTARVYPSTGEPVRKGDTITEARATNELLLYLANMLDQVYSMVDVPLNDNQLAALLSFMYNIDAAKLKGSGFLRALNDGDYERAMDIHATYTLAGGAKEQGLVNRRKWERELFEAPSDLDVVQGFVSDEPRDISLNLGTMSPTPDVVEGSAGRIEVNMDATTFDEETRTASNEPVDPSLLVPLTERVGEDEDGTLIIPSNAIR
jgi:lysozyme